MRINYEKKVFDIQIKQYYRCNLYKLLFVMLHTEIIHYRL